MPANKKLYQRHQYSGVRKKSKRSESAFKRIYGEEANRVKAWRAHEKEKPKTTYVPRKNAKVKPAVRQYAGPRKKQPDHTPEIERIIITNVYHYLEQEYEELKKTIKGVDHTPLSMYRQRTALATGVSEKTVEEILREGQANRIEMVVVREEPLETYKEPADPISLGMTESHEEATTVLDCACFPYKRRYLQATEEHASRATLHHAGQCENRLTQKKKQRLAALGSCSITIHTTPAASIQRNENRN
ncbi:hypothetical protein PYW08_012720 [Mythimna loreyi]|uniref:Uncharacterized protein n=1 Tax=Mythimna loreyi TaxID=667449 RepID=A0ACC2Q113_9NEOP|nr:hypothetical protein PYW08_012720 [Mythimna loreyi]